MKKDVTFVRSHVYPCVLIKTSFKVFIFTTQFLVHEKSKNIVRGVLE